VYENKKIPSQDTVKGGVRNVGRAHGELNGAILEKGKVVRVTKKTREEASSSKNYYRTPKIRGNRVLSR